MSHIGLVDGADHLGRCRYVELAAFAVLGTAGARCDDPAIACYLSGASRAHAWRAEQLESLLPISVGLGDVALYTHSPGNSIDEVFDILSAASWHELFWLVVAILYPEMMRCYKLRIKQCSVATDGALRRCLVRMVADLEAVTSQGKEIYEQGQLAALWPGEPVTLPVSADRQVGDVQTESSRASRMLNLLKLAGGPFGLLAGPLDAAGTLKG